MVWSAISAARLKDGELAFDILSELASRFHHRNLISAVGPMGTSYAEYPYDRPIFNIDVNGGLPRLLMEMLVFSRPGFVELLPALPSKLSKGTAGGILCPGRIEIERLEWDMKAKTICAVLNSAVDQTLELKVPEKAGSLQITQGNAVVKGSLRSPRCYEIALPAAASVKLAIVMT